MSTTRACAANRGSSTLASGASRLAARRARATPLPRASSSEDASTSPWWASLPAVHVLVFNPETDEEALYTTSRRDGDFAANDFVAFESLRDATRASVRVSDQLGEMPIVDTLDPRVVAFLADRCGYGVDVVPAGAPFDPPAVLIDESDALDAEATKGHETDELAISTVDLQKYLAGGGELAPPAAAEEEDDGAKSETRAKTRDARRRAASAMRAALTSPARRVRGAVRDAARAPARSMMTPMRAIQKSVRRAAGAPEGRERLDPLWDERTPMPSAAQAVYRALIVLAEKRLNEMDEQEGEN